MTDTDEEVMQRCIDQCVREKWTEIGDLYGCVRRGGKLVASTCSVPCGYGTIKHKSWAAQIVKGRPISPHVKHVMKRVSNRCARGYHVVLTNINTERVARMFTTQEYKERVQSDQQRIQKELRVLTGDETAQPGYVRDV